MCRGNHQGGRRCPGQSSTAAKRAAADRRRNNRRAKKNVKNFFVSQGMTDTADAVDDMTPSQIPGLLDALGVDTSVLGDVTVPVSVHASQDKRNPGEIIEIATQEAKELNIALLPPVSDQGEVPTQESILNAFNDIFHKSLGEPERSKYFSILDYGIDHCPDDIDNIFRMFNQLPFPDDFSTKTNEIYDIAMKANRRMRASTSEEMGNYKDIIFESIIEGKSAPFTDVTKEVSDKLPEGQYPYRHEGFYLLHKLKHGDMKLHDLGGGLYYMEEKQSYDEENGGHYYLYSPDNFDDIDQVIIGAQSWGEEKPDHRSFPIVYGGGITGLGREEIKKIITYNGYPDVAKQTNELAQQIRNDENARESAQHHVDSIIFNVFESKLLKLSSGDIEELHVSHNIGNKMTFAHQEAGLDTPFTTVKDMRQFRMGMMTTDRVPLSGKLKEFSEELVNVTIAPQSRDEEEEIRDTLREEVDAAGDYLIRIDTGPRMEDIDEVFLNYTGSHYPQYATDAIGLEKSPYYRDRNKIINDAIKDYQENVTIEPRNIFRGMSVPLGMEPDEYFDSVNIGDVSITTKLTSTSYLRNVATSFSGERNIVSVYHTKKGAPVEAMSANDFESEIILPVGEEYVCVGKRYDYRADSYVFYYADKDINDVDTVHES